MEQSDAPVMKSSVRVGLDQADFSGKQQESRVLEEVHVFFLSASTHELKVLNVLLHFGEMSLVLIK